MLVGVGVDEQGDKHVFGHRGRASENHEVAKGLMVEMLRRGVKSHRQYRLVINDSKVLRATIDAMFGVSSPMQRSRNQKVENVTSYLPKELNSYRRPKLCARLLKM